LGPEGANALLSALSEKADLERPFKLEIAWPEVEDFLDPCPGVEHGRQQGEIPPAIQGGTINLGQHCLNFVELEVIHGSRGRSFERHRQDPLCALQALGPARGDMTKKGVNRGKPYVPGGGLVVAIRFQVIEKGQNELGIDVLHAKVGNLPASMVGHESKQQGKAIPVA
jgi:hypothetical protein